ncbi:hypothetical protein ABQF38_16455, partial [Xanthomonas campestris]|nr:hypothetical protein [Xanthomonas campestris]
ASGDSSIHKARRISCDWWLKVRANQVTFYHSILAQHQHQHQHHWCGSFGGQCNVGGYFL